MSDPATTDSVSLEALAALEHVPDPLGELAVKLGIELTEVSASRVVATMPVVGNRQPFGLLHGGASVALAETLGSIGAAVHALPSRVPVGVDINATHHRGASEGEVTGVARALSLGKTVASYAVEVTDQAGTLLCSARITCVLKPIPPS